MSRVGKQPLKWAAGTKVSLSGRTLKVEAGKASLSQFIDPSVKVVIDEGGRVAHFEAAGPSRRTRALHGLYRALAANMVRGVEQGFEKRLEIQGVGYNAKLEGKNISLNIGFNKPVRLPIPAGLTCEVPQPTVVVVKGADRQSVGQFASDIRAIRKPEPYKGKGIRYEGEAVRRKTGKSLGA